MATQPSPPQNPPPGNIPPAAGTPTSPGAQQQPPGANLPTIMPAWHQLPQLDPPLITRLMLWLSKTDVKAIAHCTPETLMGQTSLGAMVLLTGILAFGSSFFTVWTIVEGQIGPALIVPLIYASAVMLFDRELVGYVPDQDDRFSLKFLKMLPRIVFAAVLGYAIAIPVELKVMERRIEAEIEQQVKERSRDEVQRISDIRAEADASRAQLKETVKKKEAELQRVQGLMDIEYRERAGRGPKYEAFERERNAAKQEYDAAVAAYQSFDLSKAQGDEIARRQGSVDAKFDNERRDMLARVEALEKITSRSSAAWTLSKLLTAVFVLLEMFPMILKLFSRYNEYHAYLHARREINIQKTHVLGNYALQDIATNPRHAALYGEYTDLMQLKGEDAVGVAPGVHLPPVPPNPAHPLPGANPFGIAPNVPQPPPAGLANP